MVIVSFCYQNTSIWLISTKPFSDVSLISFIFISDLFTSCQFDNPLPDKNDPQSSGSAVLVKASVITTVIL